MNKLRFIFALLLLCSVLFSCKEESTNKKIERYYEATKPNGDFEQFKKIVVINELGNCINCNNMFSFEMADSINNKDILFIISGSGSKVDISPYIDKNKDNIIWDPMAKFNEMKIVQSCAIIDLDSSTTITEVSLDRYLKNEK